MELLITGYSSSVHKLSEGRWWTWSRRRRGVQKCCRDPCRIVGRRLLQLPNHYAEPFLVRVDV
jgi:hypothetical protein